MSVPRRERADANASSARDDAVSPVQLGSSATRRMPRPERQMPVEGAAGHDPNRLDMGRLLAGHESSHLARGTAAEPALTMRSRI